MKHIKLYPNLIATGAEFMKEKIKEKKMEQELKFLGLSNYDYFLLFVIYAVGQVVGMVGSYWVLLPGIVLWSFLCHLVKRSINTKITEACKFLKGDTK